MRGGCLSLLHIYFTRRINNVDKWQWACASLHLYNGRQSTGSLLLLTSALIGKLSPRLFSLGQDLEPLLLSSVFPCDK